MMFDSDPQILEFLREFTPPPKLPEVDKDVQATVQKVMEQYQKRLERKTAEEAGEAAKQEAARRELEGSILPSWRAYGVAAGAPIVSSIARLIGKGEYADEAIRAAARIEQAAREREKGGIVPDILQSGARGAGASLTTMIPAATIAGPYGAIAVATSQEINKSITGGKDAGLRGRELAEYAITQGVWEGLPAAVMQRLGLGGVESMVSKKAVHAGLKEGLKRLGISAAHELPEELTTFLGQSLTDWLYNVESPTAESLKQGAAETTVQTLITVGFGGVPGIARSIEAGKIIKTTQEIQNYAKEGKIPSRKTFRRKWGLAPEIGGSRAQRRAFIREVAKQGEAPPGGVEPEAAVPPVVPEGPEGTIPAPVVAAEPPGAVEGIETAPKPEAVTEAPRAAEMPPEMQKLAEDAGAPPIDPVNPPVEDQTTALNKEGGAKIREFVNLPALSDEAIQTWDSVMERVAVEKADEKALDTATEVMRMRRQVTTYEYGAMALKVHKLLNDLESQQTKQAKAAEAGNKFGHKKASIQIETITGQLDLLTEAARHSRREVARALSIGQMRLSRESFDTADIIKRMQGVRGPGKRLAKKQLAEAARRSKRYADLEKQVAELQEADRIKDEQLEAALAGKVLKAYKPRRKIGKGIRERAVAEREDIKKRIRQMGLRVNDITGVTAEGTYLIGRLGITYIKEGAGTLIEVAERLRADLPDLNLTQSDVNQALIARSPKEVARAKRKNNKQVRQLVSMARMHVELEGLARGVDLAVKRKKAEVPAEVKALKKKLTEARLRFYASDIEAARKERAIETVNRLQDQLNNGLTRIKEVPKEIPPELANLQDQARQLRIEIGVDAALAKARETRQQIKEGTYIPPPKKIKKPVNKELERKQIELAKERREIRHMIADAAPWGVVKVGKEIAFTLKALKATSDFSFVMRQNMWQVFSHPILAKRAFVPAMKAFFSEYSADQINNAIRNSENGFLYEQVGLAVLDGESQDQAQRSEVFRARVIERIPGIGHIIRASGRHAAAFSNLMRTSAFDQFVDNHPEATQEQMRAFADYLNVSTGLGNLGRAGAIGDALQLAFFSPKFAVSRIQTPWALVKYRKMPGVRSAIAKDMVKVVSTGMMVLLLADLAGFFDVEWLDPEDPDWGKIRIGNHRIDIWAGFQQPARLIARIATSPAGFKEDVEGFFGGRPTDPLEVAGRFAAFKFAPIISVPRELWTRRTAVGEKVTRLETLAKLPIPMIAEDIWDAWRESGIPAGAAIAPWVLLGGGAATYEDSESATRRRIKRLQKRGKFSEAEKLFWKWNQENAKDQISRKWFLSTKK